MPEPIPSTRTVPLGLAESVEALHNVGFSVIDVNYSNLERLMVDDASVITHFRAALQRAVRLGVKPATLHAPWENYFLIHLGKGIEKAVNEARIILDIAYSYGVEVVVFHPFSSQRLGDHRVVWFNKRFFASLAEYSEREGLCVVAVENAEKARPWTSVEEVVSLVSSISSSKLSLCIDTGHAHLNGYSISRVDELASRASIACLHIHDNNGRSDEHCIPGCGTIDWSQLKKAAALKRAAYAVAEVDCKVEPAACLERARLSVALLRELLR